MYTRFNYVDVKPDRFEPLESHWREVVSGYDGLVSGWFLRQGESSHTLSIVVFESEAVARANTGQQLAEAARQVSAYRLSEPQVVLLEHRASVEPAAAGPPSCARVIDATFQPGHVDAIAAGWADGVSSYRAQTGFRGAFLSCDSATGAAKTVSMWASEADLRANESSGALKAAVAPYRNLMSADPQRSYWTVRICVPGAAS